MSPETEKAADRAGAWTSVVGSRRGPGPHCDLCGRRRGIPSGANEEQVEDALFRSVRVNGSPEATTVCGRCLRERMPRPTHARGRGRPYPPGR